MSACSCRDRPSNPSQYEKSGLGWILLNQGDPGKALAYLSAANTAAPRNPNIQYHLAVALHRVGRPGDALSMLESLLESGVSFTDKAEAEKLLQKLKPG